jgi:DNA-binding PadR family transcriptional regulator
MSTKLVILGLLKEKPLHGYEIKQLIEEQMGDWTSIAFGSIYFALKKLFDEGFIVHMGQEKVGNRPSRSVYSITKKGENEFLSLVQGIWQKFEREYYSLDIAIAFSPSLPVKELRDYIEARIRIQENALQHVQSHKSEQLARAEVPQRARLIFSHSEHHMKAELMWLKELLSALLQGELSG